MKKEFSRKVVFYIMGEKGHYVLYEFINKFGKDKVEYVVSSRDENMKKDYYKEIVSLCKKNKIKSFRRTDNPPEFNGYKFAIGWRWIIQDEENLIVLHDSILPKYRGFAPLVNMLINGEKKLGVTALFASGEYDKGDIIKQEKIDVNYPIKICQAIKAIKPLYSSLVNQISQKIFKGNKIISKTQEESRASYSLWRNYQDYFIDWSWDSKKIRRMVDAVGYPYEGAKTYLGNTLLTVVEVEDFPDKHIENRSPGKVIFVVNNEPVIVCGKGLLKIKKASYENGKSALPFKKFRSFLKKQKYDLK